MTENCPKCGEEMEEVCGFPGYVWCRDCDITKQMEEIEGMSDIWTTEKKVRVLAQTITSAQYILETIESDTDEVMEIEKDLNSAMVRCHRLERKEE